MRDHPERVSARSPSSLDAAVCLCLAVMVVRRRLLSNEVIDAGPLDTNLQ
jgi:hypothetical protein